MHLLGRSIKVELNPGTPKAQILLDLPAFNFDDQAPGRWPTPVADQRRATRCRVTCTHDAVVAGAAAASCKGCSRGTSSGATVPVTRCAWAS